MDQRPRGRRRVSSQMERKLFRRLVRVLRNAAAVDGRQRIDRRVPHRLSGGRYPNRIPIAHAEITGRAKSVAARVKTDRGVAKGLQFRSKGHVKYCLTLCVIGGPPTGIRRYSPVAKHKHGTRTLRGPAGEIVSDGGKNHFGQYNDRFSGNDLRCRKTRSCFHLHRVVCGEQIRVR